MIDTVYRNNRITRERIGQIQRHARRLRQHDRFATTTEMASDIDQLATDYLALLGIVEELAACNLLETYDIDDDDEGYICRRCRQVFGPDYDAAHDPSQHAESCLWRRARALIGPARATETGADV